MSLELQGPPRLLLDHELLARLGPGDPFALWERDLRRAGLLDLVLDHQVEPVELWELQHGITRWRQAEGAQIVPVTTGVSELTTSLGDVLAQSPREVAIGGVVMLLAWVAAGWGIFGSPLWIGMVLVLGGFMWSKLANWRSRHGEGARRSIRAAAPTRASTDGPNHEGQASRMSKVLRRLLSRSFVTVVGEVIVENTPHRTYVELRLAELDRLRTKTQDRIAEIQDTRAAIHAVNERLGRSSEDAESTALAARLEVEVSQLERVQSAQSVLLNRLAVVDTQLQTIRAVAERAMLSERARRLSDSPEVERLGLRVATVEVDVLGIEAELREAAIQLDNSDARMCSVLEVVGVEVARAPVRRTL